MARTISDKNKLPEIKNVPSHAPYKSGIKKSFVVKNFNLTQATSCFNKFDLICNREFVNPPQVQASDSLNTIFKDSNASITLIYNGNVSSLAWTLIGEFTPDDIEFINSL